ncbi:pentatricopeptide repeat-containing protein At3g04130, mitochondrial [Lactuca sativa]|uniref:Pentacotripeptide-repeat region of PRORP domain-containing protein n=1 Tax=Lactuca sativa TaxID=4236 RepID=A0A9R1UKG5_LACSA|nr:pentatricopeptide repeat-containing protein At3g04130, mitochondrial [Lactuca sativa]KAJ0188956.1 hypothetical protein LSAT_V11C800449120 [Lactuca sativa]
MPRATVKQISILQSHASFSLQFTTNAPKNINIIISKVQSGATYDEIFQSLMHDQACSTIPISDTLLSHLLHRFKDDWKSALGVFKWAESIKDHTPLPKSYEILLDILGKTKQIEKMMSLVNQIHHHHHHHHHVTLGSITKVMRRLCGVGKWQEAVKIFDDLHTFGLEKNTESMNLLLDTLCKENKVEQARKIFLELKSCIPPTPHTFNIFIHGWCKVKRVDEAHWTIQEMKGYGFSPSVITYSTIIKSYCQDSEFVKVYELLDEMKVHNCPPNVVTFTIIMCYLTKFGEFEEALGIPEKMKSFGCEPDTLFYNSLIHTLAKSGKIQEAIYVFEVEMARFKVSRNTSTFNTMIAMFCHHGKDEEAMNVVKNMGNLGDCKPDIQSFNPLLKMWLRTRKVDLWLSDLLDEMVNKYNLSLDLCTYSLLIHGLCRVNECEWAYGLFKEMIGKDIKPRYYTCALLLEEIKQMKNYDAADFIEGYMKRMKSS